MPDDATPPEDQHRRHLGLGAKTTVLIELGQRLRRARTRTPMTQAEVAENLGVIPQTVRNWESGKHEPPPLTIKKLATLYGVSQKSLLPNLDSPIIQRSLGTPFRYGRVNIAPDKITSARHEAGLTQAIVSQMTGLSLSAIRRYESGSAKPATRTLQVLASIYNKEPGWFTPRGHFTQDELIRFERSTKLTPPNQPYDDLVINTYNQSKDQLSDKSKFRIAHFIEFNLRLDRSGRPDDFGGPTATSSFTSGLPDKPSYQFSQNPP